jgi:hypothetical protein
MAPKSFALNILRAKLNVETILQALDPRKPLKMAILLTE